MTRKITLLIAALCLICGSISAQSFVFVYNGVELANNANIIVSEIDEDMGTMDAHARIKKLASENIEASLTISVEEEPIGGFIGFCGWGTTICTPVSYGIPLTRTLLVDHNDAIDPSVEVMGAYERPVNVKVKYTLVAGGEEFVLNVHFDSEASAINDLTATNSVFVSGSRDEMYLNYSFDTEAERVLNVFSITGNKVAEMPLSSNNTQVQLPKTSQGIYLYSISENGRVIKGGKYIVR